MKTRNKQMKWIGMTLFSLGICCPASWGKTWTVGQPNTPCANPDYNTIGDAINAASAGDEIDVCPALYAEQLFITQPLTLRGLSQQGVGRVLIQPAQLTVGFDPFVAPITVMNTSGVIIQNLAVDAGNNGVTGCTVAVAGIHFYNSSGLVDGAAISGARLSDPLSCTALFPGNGFGVEIDQDANANASYTVTVLNTSISDFGRNGILAVGSGETVDIENNSIAGVGPSTGVNQFGIFLARGANGRIAGNTITQGSCGAIPIADCYNLRSEGVVLRSAGQGVVIDGNTISNVQAGIFLNGFTENAAVDDVRVTNNVISGVDALSAIHIQGVSGGVFMGNRVFHVGPLTSDTSNDEEGCGLYDVSGTGSSANRIVNNRVSDAYCGVGYVTGDQLEGNTFQNTLYETLNGDNYPDAFPPAVEPGQQASPAGQTPMSPQLRKVQQ